jgi:hypothetical protein
MTDKPLDCIRTDSAVLRVRVRAKQCDGCLFGPRPVVRDYEKGRETVSVNFAADPACGFPCHCNYHGKRPEETLLCRGFYAVHKDLLPAPLFVDEDGDAEFWKNLTGQGVLG